MLDIDGSWRPEASGEVRFNNSRELCDYIDEVGLLPYFKCGVDRFSAEEFCSPRFWWSGDLERDPWIWREQIAGGSRAAYSKIFLSKAGFVSRELYPVFASYRRDGYDFDSLCDEGLVNARQRSVMEFFQNDEVLAAWQFKRQAGFGKDGAKGFEGTLSKLMMETYLTIRGFERRKNKSGLEYGWPVALYSTPETLFGYDFVRSGYRYEKREAFEILKGKIKKHFPHVSDEQIKKLLG